MRRPVRDDIPTLAQTLRDRLREDDLGAALGLLEKSPSAEAAVVVAGLREADRGVSAADKAMRGAAALQKMKLERRLAFLGTLGNNAPFIGLFGTVIGIVQAFEALGKQGMNTAQSASAAAPTGAATPPRSTRAWKSRLRWAQQSWRQATFSQL